MTVETEPTDPKDTNLGSSRNRDGVPAELLQRLYETLEKLDCFESTQSLRARFDTPDLRDWRSDVPEADDIAERVRLFVDEFRDKYRKDGRNALVLFLERVQQNVSPNLKEYRTLEDLAADLKAYLEPDTEPDTEEDKSPSISDNPNRDAWLKRVGFTVDPFKNWRGRHDDNLPMYFHAFRGFHRIRDSILNGDPTIVLGPEGSGKTSLRSVLSVLCRDSDVLVVNYENFGAFSPEMPASRETHVAQVLRLALEAIVADLDAQRCSGCKDDALPAVRQSFHRYLQYLPEEEVGSRAKLEHALAIEKESSQSQPPAGHPVSPSVAGPFSFGLTNSQPRKKHEEQTPPHAAEDLQRFCRDIKDLFGYKGLRVFVEPDPDLGLPAELEAAWQMLDSLVAQGRVLTDHSVNLSFHFFLHPRFGSYVDEIAWVARYPSCVFDLEWDNDALQGLLEDRLQNTNRRPYTRLAQLTDGGFDLDAMLIEECDRSPRNLIDLCDRVFAEHCRTEASASQALITLPEVQYVLERFQQRRATRSSKAAAPVHPLVERIQAGEHNLQEFKASLRINMHTGTRDKRMELEVAETICAFVNSAGGSLFIGVNDAGEAVGLEADIKTVRHKNEDGFRLAFDDLVSTYLGDAVQSCLDLRFLDYQGQRIAEVEVQPGTGPCYVNQVQFFIRASGSSRELKGPDMVEYISDHW